MPGPTVRWLAASPASRSHAAWKAGSEGLRSWTGVHELTRGLRVRRPLAGRYDVGLREEGRFQAEDLHEGVGVGGEGGQRVLVERHLRAVRPPGRITSTLAAKVQSRRQNSGLACQSGRPSRSAIPCRSASRSIADSSRSRTVYCRTSQQPTCMKVARVRHASVHARPGALAQFEQDLLMLRPCGEADEAGEREAQPLAVLLVVRERSRSKNVGRVARVLPAAGGARTPAARRAVSTGAPPVTVGTRNPRGPAWGRCPERSTDPGTLSRLHRLHRQVVTRLAATAIG